MKQANNFTSTKPWSEKTCVNLWRFDTEYGIIIVLEDDIIVSPTFYNYALAVTEHYKSETYLLDFHFTIFFQWGFFIPFETIHDGFASFFMKVQVPGPIWTKQQWLSFKEWYSTNQSISAEEYLPEAVIQWSDSSWKKHFWKYLAETNKFIVYPLFIFYQFGWIGIHILSPSNAYQADLSLKAPILCFQKFTRPSMFMISFWNNARELQLFNHYKEDIEMTSMGASLLTWLPRNMRYL